MSIFGVLIVLVILIGFFYWVGFIVYPLFTNPVERAQFFARPEQAIFALIGLVLLGMLIIGICIPPIGEITVFSVGTYNIRIWNIGLIGGFVWMLFGWRSMK